MDIGDVLIVLWIPLFAVMGRFSARSVRDKRFAAGLLTPLLAFALALIITFAFGQSYASNSGIPIVDIGFLFIFVVALPIFLLELLLFFFLRAKRDEMLHPKPAVPSHKLRYWERRQYKE